VNLVNIGSITVTAAAGGDGGPIEVRLDDPVNGQLLGTLNIPNTGAWETLKDFDLAITPPAGTHKLFFAFPIGGMDVDQIRFNGRGVSSNSQPRVSASAEPAQGAAPLSVRFTAAGTDPDGDRLTYAWDFGDGTTGSGRQPRHVYSAPGTYVATVTATDARGATGRAAVQVTVSGPPPPSVTATATPQSGQAPLRVTFKAVGPQGTYAWDFGDGTTGSGREPAHRYTQPGTYTAKVTVTDRNGATASAEVQVTVTPRG
jgi:PKD repeat protein